VRYVSADSLSLSLSCFDGTHNQHSHLIFSHDQPTAPENQRAATTASVKPRRRPTANARPTGPVLRASRTTALVRVHDLRIPLALAHAHAPPHARTHARPWAPHDRRAVPICSNNCTSPENGVCTDADSGVPHCQCFEGWALGPDLDCSLGTKPTLFYLYALRRTDSDLLTFPPAPPPRCSLRAVPGPGPERVLGPRVVQPHVGPVLVPSRLARGRLLAHRLPRVRPSAAHSSLSGPSQAGGLSGPTDV
jgi:hypothetical protein